jgi:hypothetical protein
LERLVLADAFLRNPRRFLVQATTPDADLGDTSLQPKADRKRHDIGALRKILAVFLGDDWDKSKVGSRKLLRMLATAKLGELPVDDLESGVRRLVNRFIAVEDYGQPGEERFEDKKNALVTHVTEVLADTEKEIIAALIQRGERDERIIVTSDLPTQHVFPMQPQSLYWALAPNTPTWVSCIRPRDLPSHSPLLKIPAERLPRLDRSGGDSFIVLGAASLSMSDLPAARPWYWLSVCETFTRFAWKVWADRHRGYLEVNRETTEQFAVYETFDKLMKSDSPTVWKYPAPPKAPSIDGLDRCLFALDVLAHLTNYLCSPMYARGGISGDWNPFAVGEGQPEGIREQMRVALAQSPVIPPPHWSLGQLLDLRRVFVTEIADQHLNLAYAGARSWVKQVYTNHQKTDLLECVWSLAKSSLEEVEELHSEMSLAQIEDYQRRVYLSNGHSNGNGSH